METTKKLAEFIVETRFEQIPKEAAETAKHAFLDCVGVALAGSVAPPGRIAIELVKENRGQSKAAVIGGGFRTTSPDAAFANGTSAHALDYDDSHASVHGHPSTFLMPVVMALGEEFKVSGKEALEAYILGLEAAAKIGKGVITTAEFYEKGWHPTAIVGTLGAAVAGAKLLKLNVDQTQITLGIAASLASGSKQNFGTMTKPLHAGNAARNGVLAAMLAKKGFTADRNILEAKFGFCNLFAKKDQYDLERITAGLGQPYELVDPGINLKPYPCCRGTHTSLDAMFELIRKEKISPDDVESIEVRIVPLHSTTLIHSNPQTGFEGKFSLQFCMAIAMVDKQAGMAEFTDAKVHEAAIQNLIRRTKMIPDPAMDEIKNKLKAGGSPVIVTVKLKNGKECTQQMNFAKGHPDVPMSREEFVAKYRDCAKLVLAKEAVERSMEMIEKMEGVKNLSTLSKVLMASK